MEQEALTVFVNTDDKQNIPDAQHGSCLNILLLFYGSTGLLKISD
jgi:hypothetical protein